MAFSVAGSLGTHISLKNSPQHSLTYPCFRDQKKTEISSFRVSKFGQPSTRIWVCRNEEIEFEERTSPNEVRKEIQRCYELIHRLGRGVAYLGSSRMGPDHPHYSQTLELGREASSMIADLLNCTTWSGAGPGLMDAATKGAMQAGKPVGGFKISKEAGEWTATNFHPYLPPKTYLTCRFFSARKHGLVDAVVRNSSTDQTAVVALPGGIGTLDEVFEILALIQVERIGSELPIPVLLMNYDSFYSKMLDFLDECEQWGTVAKGEVASLWKVCDTNSEALSYLKQFYDLPHSDGGTHKIGVQNANATVS
ncbi:LOG family [Dillenia turbinata]|uniref:LOG family n=1 Tax=Dillenia turbinata TaxID=194707 RepID=A0AAN8WFJ2_9MAGN